MKIITTETFLECTLEELWDRYWSKKGPGIGETLDSAIEVFRGESRIKPKFRIPAAGDMTDIFFDDPDLLCRFANFPTPTQKRFIESIRQVLKEESVESIVISVPWSMGGERKIRVRISGSPCGGNSPLDFETLW